MILKKIRNKIKIKNNIMMYLKLKNTIKINIKNKIKILIKTIINSNNHIIIFNKRIRNWVNNNY